MIFMSSRPQVTGGRPWTAKDANRAVVIEPRKPGVRNQTTIVTLTRITIVAKLIA